MDAEHAGFAEKVLAITAARRFHLDGRTKSEIADELKISRFRVARILDKALKDGMIRIEFDYPTGIVDYELSSLLKLRYSLLNAIVVDDYGGDEDLIVDAMGSVAASLLNDLSGPEEVLGFSWNRVMEGMLRHLSPLRARAIVQLGGVWPGADDGKTSIDLVREMAALSRGVSYTYYAPLLASDPQAAEAIRRQPNVLAAKAMYSRVTRAIMGLGAWREGGSSLWNALPEEVRDRVTSQGAIAEICGATIDSLGRPVKTDLSEQCIGISYEELVACPDVMALAFGLYKVEAIRAAIRGGLVKSLITHAAVAKELLKPE